MRKLLSSLFFLFLGGIVSLTTITVLKELQRPSLQPWHTVLLDTEFNEDRTDIDNLNKYLQLEDHIFLSLEERILAETPQSPRQELNRFYPGSWSDPLAAARNWNRTYELVHQKPKAAVLLLHGLSDSPYSLKAIGEALHQNGCSVIGLRLPGHGTAPSGMTEVTWRDFAMATRLAAKQLHNNSGKEVPLYIAGYSNGAALALEYTLSALEGEPLPQPSGLLLISPAVSVSRLAGLAKWKIMISHLPGLSQLAWLSVEPEYDPYKYNSFSMNGGVQIRGLTVRIA